MEFQQQCLDSHNNYRQKHGTPPLVLNDTISEFSQSYAERLLKQNEFKHSGNRKYGENLYYYSSTRKDAKINGEMAVHSWYDEIKFYNFSKEPSTLKAGHFTQVIWKESEELGVGIAADHKGKSIVVCNYSPPGNVIGQFVINVLPKVNTLRWSDKRSATTTVSVEKSSRKKLCACCFCFGI